MSRLRTALEVAGLATLAAGVVGVARQRREASLVARGELTAAHAATEVEPPPREDRLAQRVATWTPARPRTAAGRAAAAVWAGPATAVGTLIGVSTGARPRWDDEHGCWVFEGGRGPALKALGAVGADANAIGQVVVSRYAPTPPLLLAHEAAHVRQAERLGVFLLPLYAWFWARYGYRRHPIERAARLAARRWLEEREEA